MTCGHWGIFISVGVLPRSLPPSSLCAANAGTCALAMLQFPWVSKSKESTIKKKINTGIRCHLVSRPANTPKGWSLSPQCTNPTNHLLRFAGIGRQDTAFFVQTLCAAFVSHDCLSLADCLPPYVIAGKLLFTSGGEKHKQQCKIWQFSEMLDNQGLLWRKAFVLKPCSRLTHGHCLNVKCKFQEYYQSYTPFFFCCTFHVSVFQAFLKWRY